MGGKQMIFKCSKCEQELTSLDVTITNVVVYGSVTLFDDGTIDNWDLDHDYDYSIDEYNCPHCGYVFPAKSQDELEKYLEGAGK
jgi:DNA-directed RNA polymerase subunit RPC12/RpoP